MKIKNLLIAIGLCTSLFFITSCGDSATKKFVKELNTSYTNDGKEVELTGYIFTFHGAMVWGDLVKVGLYNVAGQTDGAIATLKIKFGKEANQIFIPEKYHGNEIEIYDNTGKKHGYLQKITVKGIVHYTNKNWKEKLEQEKEGKKDMFSNNPAMQKVREKSLNQAEEAAQEREKKTGDPNDYSFEVLVSEMLVK